MSEHGRTWGGLTGPQRAERRRDQLLDAGLNVFGTRGWNDTTVRDISVEAGLSQRYFYEQFSDREACFVGVLDRLAAEVETIVRSAVSGHGSPLDRAERTIGALLEYFLADERRLRVAFVESFATAELRVRRAQLLSSFAALASRLMTTLVPEPQRADPASLKLSAVVLSGGIAEVLVEVADGNLSVSREQLIAELLGLYEQAARSAAASLQAGA